MRDDVAHALTLGGSPVLAERTIDISTTGRSSGQLRRIEIVFYSFDGQVYLSGIPAPKPRQWLLNLVAEPRFTFHLKHGVVADLPARATVIDEPDERRRVLSAFVEQFNARRAADSPYPVAVLDEWVEGSPLARVSFLDEGVPGD
jgi:deazaflavin-dependent oxidoreductase (nitroreductase family)